MRIPDSVIESILIEDYPYVDLTTHGLGIGNRLGKITCYPKADGVVAGLDVATSLFEKVGASVKKIHCDADFVVAHDPVLVIEANASRLHAAYKSAQNVMEYCSGIANRTRDMLEKARKVNPEITVAGTRKHYPGGKYLAYVGLVAGGGIIHRQNLSDSILVFDQHRVFCKTDIEIKDAIRSLRLSAPEKKVCVEVSSIDEGLEFVRQNVDIIQCERFNVDELTSFVKSAKAINPNLIINAAGGINASNAQEYAATGIDVLVTSWIYFGKPFDIKMEFSAK